METKLLPGEDGSKKQFLAVQVISDDEDDVKLNQNLPSRTSLLTSTISSANDKSNQRKRSREIQPINVDSDDSEVEKITAQKRRKVGHSTGTQTHILASRNSIPPNDGDVKVMLDGMTLRKSLESPIIIDEEEEQKVSSISEVRYNLRLKSYFILFVPCS